MEQTFSAILKSSNGIFIIPSLPKSIPRNIKNIKAGIPNLPGMMKITTSEGEEIIAAVSEGIAKVEDNDVLLLVDTVELPEEIDENRAKRSAEQAKEALLQKKSIQDYHAAEAQMARAISRLHVKGKSINL